LFTILLSYKLTEILVDIDILIQYKILFVSLFTSFNVSKENVLSALAVPIPQELENFELLVLFYYAKCALNIHAVFSCASMILTKKSSVPASPVFSILSKSSRMEIIILSKSFKSALI